jgi:hypothetical protein
VQVTEYSKTSTPTHCNLTSISNRRPILLQPLTCEARAVPSSAYGNLEESDAWDYTNTASILLTLDARQHDRGDLRGALCILPYDIRGINLFGMDNEPQPCWEPYPPASGGVNSQEREESEDGESDDDKEGIKNEESSRY